MNKNLVVFVTTPLIKRDLKIYGVDYYRDKGVSVYFFNFWPLFSKGLTHKADVEYENQIEIDSLSTLKIQLKKFKKMNSIFLSDVALSNKSFILYVILTLYNINYHFVDNWYAIVVRENKNIDLKKIISKLCSFKITYLNNIFQKTLIFLKFNVYKCIFKKPNYVFAPTQNSFHCKAIAGKKSIIIPYSSFNFDDYLNLSLENSKRILNINYFVFVDQFLTDLPDFKRAGIKSPLTDNYYNSLNHYFEINIKNKNLEYAIAMHPRRTEDDLDVFCTDKVFIYNTYELIKDAAFVVAHYSNSIYWAILLEKPVIFIKTNEMIGTFIENIIETFAKELNKDVYNIDEGLHIINDSDLVVDKLIYEQFIKKHIVFDSENTLKTYEIIHKTLFSLD